MIFVDQLDVPPQNLIRTDSWARRDESQGASKSSTRLREKSSLHLILPQPACGITVNARSLRHRRRQGFWIVRADEF
jgi:hypothetical protein